MNQEYEKGRAGQFNSSLLLGKNYYYDYKVNLDGVLHDYYGKRYQDIELFKYNNNEYYRNGDDYFINNNPWVKCDNPYVFYEIINVDNLCDILNNATLITKDKSEEGKLTYKYQISTNTINKLLYNLDTDFDEVPNEINILLDGSSGTNTIDMNLNSFCLLDEKCNNNLSIVLNYELFNSVKNIDNPIK